MTQETHSRLAGFLWSICNLLRGPYKRNEYRKVILPLTVLRRFDCLLAPTKARVLAEHARIREKPSAVVRKAPLLHPWYVMEKYWRSRKKTAGARRSDTHWRAFEHTSEA